MKPEQCGTGRNLADLHPGDRAAIEEARAFLASRPHVCNVKLLTLSWRSEGCGWRCPTCRATYTLTRSPEPPEDHVTPYGTHPRAECGPHWCTLLPPRPTMVWIRDEVTG